MDLFHLWEQKKKKKNKINLLNCKASNLLSHFPAPEQSLCHLTPVLLTLQKTPSWAMLTCFHMWSWDDCSQWCWGFITASHQCSLPLLSSIFLNIHWFPGQLSSYPGVKVASGCSKCNCNILGEYFMNSRELMWSSALNWSYTEQQFHSWAFCCKRIFPILPFFGGGGSV